MREAWMLMSTLALAAHVASAAQSVSHMPPNGGTGVNPDTHLSISFPEPPTVK